MQAKVLKQGGDTDTNACIVGCFVGALLGYDRLFPLYRDNLLNCNVQEGYRPRPVRYSPWKGLIVCRELLKVAPKVLKYK